MLCWRKEPSRITPGWFWEKRIRAESMTTLIWQTQFESTNPGVPPSTRSKKAGEIVERIIDQSVSIAMMIQQIRLISEERTPAFSPPTPLPSFLRRGIGHPELGPWQINRQFVTQASGKLFFFFLKLNNRLAITYFSCHAKKLKD